jgi:hypothetical protein
MIAWKPLDLCRWLELSLVPRRSLTQLDHHNVPGMHFAKLGARPDMKGKVQAELEALTGLSPAATLEVIRPLLSLQDQDVYDWLEETDRLERGRRPEIHTALTTWKQYRDIENAKHDYGGAHVPEQMADTLRDDDGSEYSSESELDEEEDGVLYVTVVKADKMPRLDMLGYDRVNSPSLYVQMNMEDQQRQTPTADDTYEPKWNARFKMNVTNPESVLLIDVYNSNMMKDHLHWATLKVPLLELPEGTTWHWYRLTDFVDESRSEARHNVLTDEQRRDQDECPKGCIQLRFQYTPPELALDPHQSGGLRVNSRRGAVTDIDRFVGAYAADNLDVEARITQGLLWSTRYVVISSIYKGNPETEKFILLTYKDKKAWDNGAEALSTLRLGESEIVLDARPESRGAGFTVTNRKGSAHFRAKNKDEAAEWMTALRSLQYAEMVQWSSAHICRWLEAHNIEDGILHRVHESGVSGQFFARTVAASDYDRATAQLREKAALSSSDASTIISKLQSAQLGSVQISEWLDEAHRDVHGKSSAIKQAAALLRSPGARLHEAEEAEALAAAPPSTAMVPAEPAAAAARRPRRSSGDAELAARDAKIKQDLAHIQDRIAGRAGTGGGGGGGSAHARFDPKKWQEEQYHQRDLIEQKKLRKEQEELQQRQAQTKGDKLAARYPRGKDVYDSGHNNPDFSGTKSKYKEEAARYRDKVVERTGSETAAAGQMGRTVVPAPAPAPRSDRVPVAVRKEKRDPKVVNPKDKRSGNTLATKLESLIAVHRNLQEHQELMDAIAEHLREEDSKYLTSKKEREQKKAREEQHRKTFQDCKKYEQECKKYEKTVQALQAANEGAMERYNKARDHMKLADERKKAAEEEKARMEGLLDVERKQRLQQREKMQYQQSLLNDKQREMHTMRDREGGGGGGGGGGSDELAELKRQNEDLRTKIGREKRKADVAKHEAKERGKVLVGAAAKLEQEQRNFASMKSKLEKEALKERSEGMREGQQASDRELSELKQHIHNATEMVFEISQSLGLADGSRFKDADEMNRHDLIGAVKESVLKGVKAEKEKKDAQKEVRQLKSEVKELKRLLRQEQDQSYRMLEEKTGSGKGGGGKGGGGGGKGGGESEELAQLKSQVSVHETQMEGERRNTAREKDKVMKLEQELRRAKHELRELEEHSEQVSRHTDRLKSTRMAEDHISKAKLREQRQEQRLSQLHAGQWVHKYHSGGSTDKRWLELSADNKMLTYGKSKAKSNKEIPIDDIRYIHFGHVSENMTERHAGRTDTPEWMCFQVVLRTRSIDFSAETEEEAALWVIGLRTLLEQKRGDARGQEVGRFFWARASMKTRAMAEVEGRSHAKFLAENVRRAADTWWEDAPAAAAASATGRGGGGTASGYMSSSYRGGGGGGGLGMMTSPGATRRLSPGVTRRMSPNRLSYGSPQHYSPRGGGGGGGGGYGGSPRGGGGGRSPGLSGISPRTAGGAPSTRLESPPQSRRSPVTRRREYPRSATERER